MSIKEDLHVLQKNELINETSNEKWMLTDKGIEIGYTLVFGNTILGAMATATGILTKAWLTSKKRAQTKLGNK